MSGMRLGLSGYLVAKMMLYSVRVWDNDRQVSDRLTVASPIGSLTVLNRIVRSDRPNSCVIEWECIPLATETV